MKALGIYLTRDQAKKLMVEVDYDGSGTIEFDEFKKLIGEKI
jgi:Ca2+-binding EF-hand superfamily protein